MSHNPFLLDLLAFCNLSKFNNFLSCFFLIYLLAVSIKSFSYFSKSFMTILEPWGEWTDWESCSKTCDGGLQSKRRSCRVPDNSVCEGEKERSKKCITSACHLKHVECTKINGFDIGYKL